jgi:outer membrane receptor protein involved in Fe transport
MSRTANTLNTRRMGAGQTNVLRARPPRCTALHLAALAALGTLSLGAAHAQVVAAPADAASAPAVQQVTISASRIDRLGYVAPTPTTVIGALALEQRAAVNVGDVLNEIPAFRGSVTPSAGGLGNTGQFLADLRGLGAQRTLVLLGRQRLPVTSIPGQGSTPGTTNLSIIPTALIRSVDVVTGGASAAYGSDAVAGVVNIILDDKLQGVKGSVQYGATRYDDARDLFASLAGGTSFADGRGHVILGGEYNSNSGTGNYNDKREWGRKNYGSVLNLPANRAAGVPANIIGENTGMHFRAATYGGLVQTAGPLANLAFVRGANGAVTTARFSPGLYGSTNLDAFTNEALAANVAAGIENLNLQQLRPELERGNVLAQVSYQISDRLSVFVQPLVSHVRSNGILIARRDGAGAGPALRIQNDNPYLQAALTPAQLAQVPGFTPGNTQFGGGLTIGYLGNLFGPIQGEATHTTTRLSTGLKGSFGESWSWDITATSAKNKADRNLSNNFDNTNFRNAIDVIVVGGQEVCRSEAARAAGCRPLNILGSPSGSQAAFDYVGGTASGTTTTRLDAYSASLQGEPFSLWAGPVSVGAGVEHRVDSLEVVTDPRSQSSTWFSGVGTAFPQTKLKVDEVYAETIVPLLKAAPLAKTLDFNGAVRYTDYSTSGKVTSWKGGLSWEPSDGVRLRGTRSRDIRAPNLVDLYSPITTVAPIPVDPRTALSGVPAMTNLPTTGGNPALKPESANTTTVGIVFQPRSLRRLSMSADYYNIDVKDAITSTSATNVVNACLPNGVYSGSPLCSLITFANNDPVRGQILAVSAQQANVGVFKTRGVDLQLSYAQPLKELAGGLPGILNIGLLATRVFEFSTSADINERFPNGVNRAGQTGAAFGGPAGLPKWSWTGNFDYRLDRLALNTQVRFISSGKQDNALVGPDQSNYSPTLANSVNNNKVPSYALFNMGASYDFGSKGQRRELYLTVNNVFDRDPPYPANGSAYYDLLGRAFKVGARFSF